MPIDYYTLFKCSIIEVSAEVKPSGSIKNGLLVRFNAIFEGLFHCPVPSFSIAQFREENKHY